MTETPKLTQLYNDLIHQINVDMKDFAPIQSLSNKINVKPGKIVLILIFVIVLLTLIDICANIFVTFFGMVYPAYMSFKAIKKQSDQERKKWLSYWIVFGLLTAFDTLLKWGLFFIPCYYTMKAIFFIWMFYPKSNGSMIIYNKILRPQLLKLQEATKKYKS